MSLAIVVPILSQFKLASEMLASIDVDADIVIVPNWVNNRGVAASWNHGINMAMKMGHNEVLVCNDDIVFGPGSIQKMHNTLIGTPDAVLVSAAQNGQKVDHEVVHEGADFFCFMVKASELLSAFGEFDENIYPAYFEDNDMHYRIGLGESWKTYIRGDADVRHIGSASQNANPSAPNCPSHVFEGIRAYYIRKWGGQPGEETFSTPWDSGKPTNVWNGMDSINPDPTDMFLTSSE